MHEIDFFLIGAPKTGSYSLWYYLSKHPELCLSKDKEPHIFSERSSGEIEKLIEEQFHHKEPGQKCIEASLYLPDIGYSEKIAKSFPNGKFIVSLRDPIDRLLSNYHYRISRGDESRSLEEILDNWENDNLVNGSLYYKNLESFIKIFGKNSFLILPLEEVNQNFDTVFAKLFKFLGVDSSFKLHNEGKLNVTIPKGNLLNSLFEWNKGSRSWNRPNISSPRTSILPKQLRNYFSKKGLDKAKKEREITKEIIFRDEYKVLIDKFKEERCALEKKFEINLDYWKNLN